MPKRITQEQRDAVLHMLAEGHDRDSIAAAVGVTPGQVSAVSAHVKMGTYSLPSIETIGANGTTADSRAAKVLERLRTSTATALIRTQIAIGSPAASVRTSWRRPLLPS